MAPLGERRARRVAAERLRQYLAFSFRGNVERADERVASRFAAPHRARYVRMCPQTWDGGISMRVGLLQPKDLKYEVICKGIRALIANGTFAPDAERRQQSMQQEKQRKNLHRWVVADKAVQQFDAAAHGSYSLSDRETERASAHRDLSAVLVRAPPPRKQLFIWLGTLPASTWPLAPVPCLTTACGERQTGSLSIRRIVRRKRRGWYR